MPYEEIQTIYKTIKSKFAPEYINIFTNRGVEMAYDSKPDDLEVIKVPHAIFAELENPTSSKTTVKVTNTNSDQFVVKSHSIRLEPL